MKEITMKINQKYYIQSCSRFENTAKKLMKEGYTYIDCIKIREKIFEYFVDDYPGWMEIETDIIAKSIHEGSLETETQEELTLPDQEGH